MSDTEKGGKGAGHEYWSRRPCKRKFPTPGRVTKRLTNRAERRANKKLDE